MSLPPGPPTLQGSPSVGDSPDGARGAALWSLRGQDWVGRGPAPQLKDAGAAAGTWVPSFKAKGSLWGLSPWLLLGLLAACQTVAPTLPGAGAGCGRELPFQDH